MSTVIVALLLSVAPTVNLAGRRSLGPTEPRDVNGNLPAPKGLADSEWSSIRKEHLRHRQAAVAVEGGWQARNYRQNWLKAWPARRFFRFILLVRIPVSLRFIPIGFFGGEHPIVPFLAPGSVGTETTATSRIERN